MRTLAGKRKEQITSVAFLKLETPVNLRNNSPTSAEASFREARHLAGREREIGVKSEKKRGSGEAEASFAAETT